jgi:hypothetical protein
MLSFYFNLDRDPAEKLVQRALSHTDKDVQEIGGHYL